MHPEASFLIFFGIYLFFYCAWCLPIVSLLCLHDKSYNISTRNCHYYLWSFYFHKSGEKAENCLAALNHNSSWLLLRKVAKKKKLHRENVTSFAFYHGWLLLKNVKINYRVVWNGRDNLVKDKLRPVSNIEDMLSKLGWVIPKVDYNVKSKNKTLMMFKIINGSDNLLFKMTFSP